jgi:hypothetical protein
LRISPMLSRSWFILRIKLRLTTSGWHFNSWLRFILGKIHHWSSLTTQSEWIIPWPWDWSLSRPWSLTFTLAASPTLRPWILFKNWWSLFLHLSRNWLVRVKYLWLLFIWFKLWWFWIIQRLCICFNLLSLWNAWLDSLYFHSLYLFLSVSYFLLWLSLIDRFLNFRRTLSPCWALPAQPIDGWRFGPLLSFHPVLPLFIKILEFFVDIFHLIVIEEIRLPAYHVMNRINLIHHDKIWIVVIKLDSFDKSS